MITYSSMKKLIFLTGILFVSAALSFGAIAEKEITAEGLAPGTSPTARDAALGRALRSAVEQGVGVLIDSETLVENFQVLDDKVYSEAKGYVTGYEIISEKSGDGLYRVKIKARVALGALTEDVKALGIIRAKLDNPRIIVLMDEYIDGVIQPRNIAGAEIEKVLMGKKFPVVSKAQLEKIKEKDATLAYSDPDKAAALGRRFGAEVVITGRATSDLIETSRPYGVAVYAYEARIEARGIKTDNAEVLAVDSVTAGARGSGRVPTANKAISGASEKLSDSFMKRIAEKWRTEIYNEKNVLLICGNADLEKAESLKKILERSDGVKGVDHRSLTGGVLELDVRFFGSTGQLVSILKGTGRPRVEVTGRTANRIDLEFID